MIGLIFWEDRIIRVSISAGSNVTVMVASVILPHLALIKDQIRVWFVLSVD